MTTKIEHERRFIVRSIDPDFVRMQRRTELLKQGYIDNNLRVRIGSGTATVPYVELTSKVGKGLSREEKTESISFAAGNLLLESTKYVIEKTRYVMYDGWEVDFFGGKLQGLVLAEFEHEDEDVVRAATLPVYINDAVEVTETLTNRQLAKTAYFLDSSPGQDGLPIRDLVKASVPKIVLTGAPCSGKSSALARLKLEEPTLHCVPETATIVLGQVQATPDIGTHWFQHTIRRVQKSFEDAATQQALKNKKHAVILDRGTLDSAAFMGGVEKYESLLRTNQQLEFGRYEAVILLDLPPREIFEREKSNNPVRRETYEEALAIEQALIKIWSGHPRFSRVRSGEDVTWDDKFRAVKSLIEGRIKDYET